MYLGVCMFAAIFHFEETKSNNSNSNRRFNFAEPHAPLLPKRKTSESQYQVHLERFIARHPLGGAIVARRGYTNSPPFVTPHVENFIFISLPE
jgi:hypothetical protein